MPDVPVGPFPAAYHQSAHAVLESSWHHCILPSFGNTFHASLVDSWGSYLLAIRIRS